MNTENMKAIAVTHPYREGQRFDEIVIDCGDNGIPGELNLSDISVEGRNITGIEREDNAILIQLEYSDEGATELREDPSTARKPMPGAPFNPAMVMPLQKYIQPHATVCISGEAVETTEIRESIVDEFVSGRKYRLYYNLYIPEQKRDMEHPDDDGKYPLVVFIPDASVNQDDPRFALLHGMGATGFAMPEVQRENPCYILALQIPPRIPFVSDDFSCADEFDDIKKIIDDIIDEHSIDTSRIYVLGGSQGCMSSCELNCRYPGFFAAAILAGGQWDPERMAHNCGKGNFWIFVSDGDEKAYPGMLAVTEALRRAGADIRTYHMNAKDATEKKEAEIAAAARDIAGIRFTIFDNHSVVPDGAMDNGGTNHMGTWPEVYSYLQLKRWLFEQSV